MDKEICFLGIIKDGEILMKVLEDSIFMGKLTYPSPIDFGLDKDDFDYEEVDYRFAIQKNSIMIDMNYKIKVCKIASKEIDLDAISINKNVDEIGYIWLDVSKIHTFDLSPIALKVIDKII
jgi:hypothetical protein